MTFNSMAMGVGKQLISTVVLQGRLSMKNSLYIWLYFLKSSFMLVRKTVTSTRFSHDDPDDSRKGKERPTPQSPNVGFFLRGLSGVQHSHPEHGF